MNVSLGSPTLILVPTELELRRLTDAGGFDVGLGTVAACGFGPVAAAARTAELLALLRPARVLLLGICGTFDEDSLPVGEATCFATVAIEGVGVGEGDRLIAPPALGFPQWPGSPASGARPARDPIHDELALSRPARMTPAGSARERASLLLSTCAASDSPEHAAARRRRHPRALAEDMEGFSVALACALRATPLCIVRGASNVVGDRDAAHWRIPRALEAARRLALDVLRSNDAWAPPAPADTANAVSAP